MAGLKPKVAEAEMEAAFWRGAIDYRPEEGIGEVLERMTELGVRAAVVSNSGYSGDVLIGELERHNLWRTFEFLMSSADYGVRKPHPKLLQVALRKLHLDARDVWFVGDKPRYDIVGAKTVGMTAIWYNRQRADSGGIAPDLEVRNWHEFRGKLESLAVPT